MKAGVLPAPVGPPPPPPPPALGERSCGELAAGQVIVAPPPSTVPNTGVTEAPPRGPAIGSWGVSASEPFSDVTPEEIEATLPRDTYDRLQNMYAEGVLKKGDLDAPCLAALRQLPLHLQDQVMSHIEYERVFVINTRSKSGMIFSCVQKSREGYLDVRGIGSVDPWRHILQAQVQPKRQLLQLVPEGQWLKQADGEPVEFLLDLSQDKALGVPGVRMSLLLGVTVADLKARLSVMGSMIPVNQMNLREETLGLLRNERTLAYYNMKPGTVLALSRRTRGRGARPHTLEELESIVLPPPLRVASK